MTTTTELPLWTSFDIANPKRGVNLIIRLKDGRELKGQSWHTELIFDDVFSDKIEGGHYDLQIQSTHWKYA
jgi:hypothetical protein